MRMNNKLRRTTFKNLEQNQDSLFSINEKRIQIKRPTKTNPSLRQYKVDASLDTNEIFKSYGIIDARQENLPISAFNIDEIVNKIICGDSAKVLTRIPSNTIRCVITSPPYWNTVDYDVNGQYGQCSYEQYLDQLLFVWQECNRILKPNGKLCINTPIVPVPKELISSQHTRHLKNLNSDIELTILQNIPTLHRYSLYIWQKQTTEKMFGSYPYPPNIYEQNTVEFINVFVKSGAPEKFSKVVKDASKLSETEWMDLTRQIWNIYPEDVKRSTHPAPFPRAMPNRLIAMYTFKKVAIHREWFPGDIVLDPFCGVGATCRAAKELQRNFIGIDLVPDFCIEAARQIARWPSSGKIVLMKNNNKEQSDTIIEKLL